MNDSYYDLLEISGNSTKEQIRNAYRRLSIKWHPDTNHGSKLSEETFKRIAQAYSILMNDGSRSQYDKWLASASSGFDQVASDEGAATAIFYQEMMEYALELTSYNVRWRKIAKTLIQRGCPAPIATSIAQEVEMQRKVHIRNAFRKKLYWSIPLFIASSGVLILFIFINFVSFFTTVIGTLWLIGLYATLASIWRIATGRTPVEPKPADNESSNIVSDTPKNYCPSCNKIYEKATVCPVHGSRLTGIV